MSLNESEVPLPTPERTNFDILTDKIRDEIRTRMSQLEEWSDWLILNRDRVNKLDPCPEIFESANGWFLDLNYLSHEEVMNVIQIFPGKWDKELNGERINYINREAKVRCYAGQPPPSCRLVEVEVEIPPQPARKEKRFKLVCKEEQTDPSQTPEPDGSQSV